MGDRRNQCRSPTTMGGQMERVVLFLGELALVLAGIFCIVMFVLLIVSMALAAFRKLLEFREL
jgi:hypothetical protein